MKSGVQVARSYCAPESILIHEGGARGKVKTLAGEGVGTVWIRKGGRRALFVSWCPKGEISTGREILGALQDLTLRLGWDTCPLDWASRGHEAQGPESWAEPCTGAQHDASTSGLQNMVAFKSHAVSSGTAVILCKRNGGNKGRTNQFYLSHTIELPQLRLKNQRWS